MKKILLRALILGFLIVVIACIPGAASYLITFLVPPRIFYVIGGVIILILLKILYELRNRRDD